MFEIFYFSILPFYYAYINIYFIGILNIKDYNT